MFKVGFKVREDLGADLTKSVREWRDRGGRREDDEFSVGLLLGFAVEFEVGDGEPANELRAHSERMRARARCRGLRQARRTVGRDGRKVLVLQWYRERPGDLIASAALPRVVLTGERLA